MNSPSSPQTSKDPPDTENDPDAVGGPPRRKSSEERALPPSKRRKAEVEWEGCRADANGAADAREESSVPEDSTRTHREGQTSLAGDVSGQDSDSKREPEWLELLDTSDNTPYFYNMTTHETSWSLPDGARVRGKILPEDDVTRGANAPEGKSDETQLEDDYEPADSAEVRGASSGESEEEINGADEEDERPRREVGLQNRSRLKSMLDSLEEWSALGEEEAVPLPLPESLASLPVALRVYIRHDRPPTIEEMGRPARQQIKMSDIRKVSYIQGHEDYNIWYHKYSTERDRAGRFGGPEGLCPARYHCNPFRDVGWTRADLSQGETPLEGRVDIGRPGGMKPICLYFARGCCYKGSECEYYHHLPTKFESENLNLMYDIFGRERFSRNRDDMNGIGSFNSKSTTLYITDYGTPGTTSSSTGAGGKDVILNYFSIYGPILDVKVVKNFTFVTYAYRPSAEFAKVAMNQYHLDDPNQVITVKWATTTK